MPTNNKGKNNGVSTFRTYKKKNAALIASKYSPNLIFLCECDFDLLLLFLKLLGEPEP
jgi:hypothetical protein